MERHGARDLRLLIGALSAESYGVTVLCAEFSTAEAFGAYYDEVMTDDEVQGIVRRAESA